MKLISTSLLITFIFIGCGVQKNTASLENSTTVEAPTLNDSTLVISFEQTACYGSCPVQKIEVLHNGYATYHGERYVAQIGDYYATISSTDIQEVYSKAVELHFFSLEKEYTSPVTDLPSTLITITTPTQSHSVRAYGSVPSNLQEFITYLGNHFQKVVWTKK